MKFADPGWTQTGDRGSAWRRGASEELRLRGADAVYAAVARQYGTTLITLDRQQLERLPPEVRTARPAEVLGEMGNRP